MAASAKITRYVDSFDRAVVTKSAQPAKTAFILSARLVTFLEGS